jgi:hypothetical protein
MRLEEMREYFREHKAHTRQLRWQLLCRSPLDNIHYGAVWLDAHPGDRWNTAKERKRGWTHMFADDYAKDIAHVFAVTGFQDEPYVRLEEHMDDTALARAKIVGWMRARQEMFFGPDWFDD